MTRYTITFREVDYRALCDHLFVDRTVERAAYLLCGEARTKDERRLLVREVIPVPDAAVSSSAVHMNIPAPSFVSAIRRAADQKSSFVFVHSHPDGFPDHSAQDDRTEPALFAAAYNRIRGDHVHASLVLSDPQTPVGRVWLDGGRTAPVARIRVIGNRFQFHQPAGTDPLPQFFDRQVRAFGPEIQRLLGTLTIGVVGIGGTGSAVVQELARLGVGHLVISDGDRFDPTNVNRVYGSSVFDAGLAKVNIGARAINELGLHTQVTILPRAISYRSAAEELRQCDVLFGCTDDAWGRAILNTIVTRYYIPLIDMSARVYATDGSIDSVHGRVTTVTPESACLYCRGRVTAKQVSDQVLWETSPDEARGQVRLGYVDDLPDPAPAVVPFTTAVAAQAIIELLHRLTGFLGTDRHSTETLHLFHFTSLRTNTALKDSACACAQRQLFGRGDEARFLGMSWRNE